MFELKFANYGQARELNATLEEVEIFKIIRNIVVAADFDEAPLNLVRKADNYVTAKYGDWDIARIKFTERSKWIVLPVVGGSKNKHTLNAPEDVKALLPDIVESVHRTINFS